jgi:Fe-S cluster assembly protein SufD
MNKKEVFLQKFIEQETPTPYLVDLKKVAKTAIENLDFPTTRDEFWKYTRLGKLINQEFSQNPDFNIERTQITEYLLDGCDHLIFINGFYSEELSNISNDQLTITPLAKYKTNDQKTIEEKYGHLTNHKEDIFSAINTYYATNGIALNVEKGIVHEKPIQVLHISTGEAVAYNPRNLIVLGKGASAEVYFTRISIDSTAFSNSVTEVYIDENAELNLVDWQNQGSNDYQINNLFVDQKKDSRFYNTTVSTGGLQIRNNIFVKLDGENINSYLNGLTLTKNNQHIDNHTIIDHTKPNCDSFESYKGVASDKSTIVFNGKVFVRKDAQKTNAFQSNSNILLSDDANIYSKPELEIYADDVKCSHGSTTGQMDKEALFYLRSRGISKEKARKIMIQAFAEEVLEHIKNKPFQNMIVEAIEENYFM